MLVIAERFMGLSEHFLARAFKRNYSKVKLSGYHHGAPLSLKDAAIYDMGVNKLQFSKVFAWDNDQQHWLLKESVPSQGQSIALRFNAFYGLNGKRLAPPGDYDVIAEIVSPILKDADLLTIHLDKIHCDYPHLKQPTIDLNNKRKHSQELLHVIQREKAAKKASNVAVLSHSKLERIARYLLTEKNEIASNEFDAITRKWRTVEVQNQSFALHLEHQGDNIVQYFAKASVIALFYKVSLPHLFRYGLMTKEFYPKILDNGAIGVYRDEGRIHVLTPYGVISDPIEDPTAPSLKFHNNHFSLIEVSQTPITLEHEGKVYKIYSIVKGHKGESLPQVHLAADQKTPHSTGVDWSKLRDMVYKNLAF